MPLNNQLLSRNRWPFYYRLYCTSNYAYTTIRDRLNKQKQNERKIMNTFYVSALTYVLGAQEF